MHRRLVPLAAALIAASSALWVGPSASAEEAPHLDLPAGEACAFPLRITLDSIPAHGQVSRLLPGVPARTLVAGIGLGFTFANLDNGSAFSSRANGAPEIYSGVAESQTTTWNVMGHTVFLLGPTDLDWNTPRRAMGPAVLLVTGRAVYTRAAGPLDESRPFTFLRPFSGTVLDICKALS